MEKQLYFKGVKYVGDLYLKYVFLEFEGSPIIFVCTDKKNNFYLCQCSEIRGLSRWIIAKTTYVTIEQLVKKEIDIYTAIKMNGKRKCIYELYVDKSTACKVLNFDKTAKKIEISSKVSVNEIGKDVTNRTCIVSVNLVIGDRTPKEPFFIDVTMQSKFKWHEDLDGKINGMLRINAPSLLIAYIRPIISSLTASSPYPSYYLPFINFTADETEQKTRKHRATKA